MGCRESVGERKVQFRQVENGAGELNAENLIKASTSNQIALRKLQA